jgi:hypothetical protein
MVAVRAAILDGQRMKAKDVEQHVVVGFRRFFKVNPNDCFLFLKQTGKLLDRKSFLNSFRAFAVNEDFHLLLLGDLR